MTGAPSFVTPPEPWEALVAAEQEYAARRMELFAAGAESQLRKALASPRGRGAALRVLADAPPELTMALIDAVFGGAVTTHAQVGVARSVIGRLDPGWLSRALKPMVSAWIERPEATWEDLRRAAELMSDLGQRALLDQVVERANRSDDEDVKEVAEDFRAR